MSLLARRSLMAMNNMEEKNMEVIFTTEFELEATVTSNTITDIMTIDTGLTETDVDAGEDFIAEIRLLEDWETDDTIVRQLDRFEFLYVGDGGYCSALYTGANPTCGKANNVDVYSDFGTANQGVYVRLASRWLQTLTISTRKNGVPVAVAGRYQLLLYRTGLNHRNDYR